MRAGRWDMAATTPALRADVHGGLPIDLGWRTQGRAGRDWPPLKVCSRPHRHHRLVVTYAGAVSPASNGGCIALIV